MDWLQRAAASILPQSEDKNNFAQALTEWRFVGMDESLHADQTCELCGHFPIKYKFFIQNRFNANEMFVGSECINKFDDHGLQLLDSNGEVVSKNTLSDAMRETFRDALVTLLKQYPAKNPAFTNVDSLLNIIENKDGSVSAGQVPLFYYPYRDSSDEEKEIFHKYLRVNFRREKSRNDFDQLLATNGWKAQFIKKFMTSQQKRRYGLA